MAYRINMLCSRFCTKKRGYLYQHLRLLKKINAACCCLSCKEIICSASIFRTSSLTFSLQWSIVSTFDSTSPRNLVRIVGRAPLGLLASWIQQRQWYQYELYKLCSKQHQQYLFNLYKSNRIIFYQNMTKSNWIR